MRAVEMQSTAAPKLGVGTDPLARIRIVLVEPSHPGNIGAAARAMKAMGLRQLALVNPRDFPSAEATARASGADDLLVAARLYSTLEEAIAECGVVVGTTARTRHLEWPVFNPRDLAPWLLERTSGADAALVFGREQSGLSNSELALCQRVVRIPTDEEFSSLNIAQAVQVCVYELRVAARLGTETPAANGEPLATASELAGALTHLLAVMERVDFYHPSRPKLLPTRLQRFLNSNELLRSEVQILRGFLTAIEEQLGESRLG
jgi:tRNA (cytidine32/uridine32-2'-O)-methyltransferase